jgi:D-glycero-D-manno-heptose 1,7-bisphosphate phosphatase
MLVLLDRDGVINRDAKPGILSVEQFQFLPGAIDAIAALTRAGFTIAICTNQSAVGRHIISQKTLDDIHAHMLAAIRAGGGNIERIYVATDTPEAPTARRKPGPGMLEEALHDFKAHAHLTPMVGDMLRDMEAAHAAGCPRILVRTGKGIHTYERGIPPHLEPVTHVADLAAAAEHICAHYTGA